MERILEAQNHTLIEVAKILREPGDIVISTNESHLRLAMWLEELHAARAGIEIARETLAKTQSKADKALEFAFRYNWDEGIAP